MQAVDYFLWALQRFYEPRKNEKTGEVVREDRYLRMLWPQIGEIHDLHHGPDRGTYFNQGNPLLMESRFALSKGKTKKS